MRNLWIPTWQMLSKVPLGIVIALVQMFLYAHLDVFLNPSVVPQAENMIIFYMMMTLTITVASGFVPTEIKKPFWNGFTSFLIAFILFAGFLVASDIQTSAKIFQVSTLVLTGVSAITMSILFAIVVAYPEEYVFRGVVPKFIGIIPSNVIFALFHWGVYGGDMMSLFVAFVFGMIFSGVRIGTNLIGGSGLLASVGMHTAWNLRILGALGILGRVFTVPWLV